MMSTFHPCTKHSVISGIQTEAADARSPNHKPLTPLLDGFLQPFRSAILIRPRCLVSYSCPHSSSSPPSPAPTDQLGKPIIRYKQILAVLVRTRHAPFNQAYQLALPKVSNSLQCDVVEPAVPLL